MVRVAEKVSPGFFSFNSDAVKNNRSYHTVAILCTEDPTKNNVRNSHVLQRHLVVPSSLFISGLFCKRFIF